MRKTIAVLCTFATLLTNSFAASYKAIPDWLKLPEGRPQIGNMHGDIAVSSKGDIYISTMDPKAGVQVYGADGKFIRTLPDAPNDFHGFVIHKNSEGEFLYGARLTAQTIVKLTLEGTQVLSIPATAIPDEFKNKGKDGTPFLRLTGMDVAPNGDLYVTDGYSSDYVHRFDKTGKYLKSFGGKKEPYGFKTLHKIAIDTRFTPARIIGCDRANMRVVHMSLDGEFLGVVATDLLLPAAVTIQGDYALIGELKGQVTILDKAGKVVTKLGTNTAADQVGKNTVEPAKWVTGTVTAPHGVAFDAKGNIYVAEYSTVGRVHRFDKQ
jgi:sugar lactone lactonase YvrE